jgi:hypothetical protein
MIADVFTVPTAPTVQRNNSATETFKRDLDLGGQASDVGLGGGAEENVREGHRRAVRMTGQVAASLWCGIPGKGRSRGHGVQTWGQ